MNRLIAALAFILTLSISLPLWAQSGPGWAHGKVPSASEWEAQWEGKLNAPAPGSEGNLLLKSGGGLGAYGGTACPVGQVPNGLDANGAVSGCATPAGGGTPGGASLQGQFNNSSAFGGYAIAFDPVAMGSAAGIKTATTGSITIGTPTLTVASATGWRVGMGIAVANAGTGGNTELITVVDNIVGSTFTLHTNAIATATTQAVNHDDTAALVSAVANNRNVILSPGDYNVTGPITFNNPGSFKGMSAGVQIWNRGTTNHVLDVTWSSPFWGPTNPANANIPGGLHIADLTINQAAGITPTDGAAVHILGTDNNNYVENVWIERIVINQTYYGVFEDANQVANSYNDLRIYGTLGACLYINSPTASGDDHWLNIECASGRPGGQVLITSADTQEFYGLQLNGAGINFNGATPTDIQGLRFHNTKVEGDFVGPANSWDFGTQGAQRILIIGGETCCSAGPMLNLDKLADSEVNWYGTIQKTGRPFNTELYTTDIPGEVIYGYRINTNSGGSVDEQFLNNQTKGLRFGAFGSAYATTDLQGKAIIGSTSATDLILASNASGTSGTEAVSIRAGGYPLANEQLRSDYLGLKFDSGFYIPGATSGKVTVGAPAVAGTTTFNFPGSNGLAGSALTSDGSGNSSWTDGLTVGSGIVTIPTARAKYVCSAACDLFLPATAAGNQFYVANDVGVTAQIALEPPTGTQYGKTDDTAYCTAGQGLLSGGAATDKIELIGRDSTHYLVKQSTGTWTCAANGHALVAHTVKSSSTPNTTVVSDAINTSTATLLVVAIGADDTGANLPGTLTDSKSNSWTALTPKSNATGGAYSIIYYSNSTPTVGSGHTFTFTTGTNSYPSIAVAAFTGTPLDFVAENGNNTAVNVHSVQPGSVTPSTAGGIIFTAVARNADTTPVTIDSGFTISDQVPHGAVWVGVALAYQLQLGTIATNPTWQFPPFLASDNVSATIAAFK